MNRSYLRIALCRSFLVTCLALFCGALPATGVLVVEAGSVQPAKETQVAFCPNCGTQIPEGAAGCPKCATAGAPAATAPVAVSAGGLTDNVAGMLAYVTIIPAILFLVLEPYNKKRFIRFHSFQSIFFGIAWFILWVVLGIIGHIPFLGWATILIWPLIGLGGLIVWLILVLKAYQGQMFKLPVIGDMAEKQADAV